MAVEVRERVRELTAKSRVSILNSLTSSEGVEMLLGRKSRVAPSSQPWAE